MARTKKPAAKPLTETLVVSSKVGAAFLGISQRWVQQLGTDGWAKPLSRGQWNLAELIQGYAASLKDENARKTKSAADSRVRDARAAEIEMRIAREDRKVIDLGEAAAALDRVVGDFLQAVGGLPARITRDPRERQRIEAICDAERLRLSDRFAESAQALRTGLPADQADDEDDA